MRLSRPLKPPVRRVHDSRGTTPVSAAPWIAVLMPVLLFGAPATAEAQSLLAREGLGIPIEPLDARERGLGSAGVGLTGWHVSQVSPAASAGLPLPSIAVSFQPVTTTLTDGREAGFTRFPSLAVSYPFGANVLSLQAGSFLDQEWEVRVDRTLVLGDEEVQAEDVHTSTGSIGRIQVGWARRLTPSLALGATVGSHVGTLEQVFRRTIQSSGSLSGDLGSFGIQGRARASGLVAGAGAVWDPLSLVRVSGSVLWSDELELSPSGSGEESDRSYDLPLQLRGGGTVTLTEGLALHLGGSYADWGDVDADLQEGMSAGAAWTYGGGVEWSGTSFIGRTMPLRLGARHNDLPFLSGGESAVERTLSGGLGLNLVEVEGEEDPRARADFGLERGTREAGSLSESFWRVTFSVRVSTG